MTSSGQADNPSKNRFREKNRPPNGEPWIWLTRKMLESISWRAMPAHARQVVDRIMIEHMHHGGLHNGQLVVTYLQFIGFGIRRQSVAAGIAIASDLGWIDVVERGMRSFGTAKRANRYGLTWLPREDWTPASNRWQALTLEHIKAILDTHAQVRSKSISPVPESELFPVPESVPLRSSTG